MMTLTSAGALNASDTITAAQNARTLYLAKSVLEVMSLQTAHTSKKGISILH